MEKTSEKPRAGDPWIWAATVIPRTVVVVIAMTQVMQKGVRDRLY